MRSSRTALLLLAPLVIAAETHACPGGNCPTKSAGSSVNTVKPGAVSAQPIAALDFSAASDPAPMAPVASTATANPGAYLQRQAFACIDFERGADGSWKAVRAVAFPAPEGRLSIDTGTLYQPGQFVSGYDLGSMLEHDCPSGQP